MLQFGDTKVSGTALANRFLKGEFQSKPFVLFANFEPSLELLSAVHDLMDLVLTLNRHANKSPDVLQLLARHQSNIIALFELECAQPHFAPTLFFADEETLGLTHAQRPPAEERLIKRLIVRGQTRLNDIKQRIASKRQALALRKKK